jgi:glutamate dehydrogenase
VDSLLFLDRSRPDRVDVEVLNPDREGAGWSAPVTVVQTNISERPFIVDTIREFLSSEALQIAHLVYPLMTVERNEDGWITDLHPPDESAQTESMVYAEVSRVADSEARDSLRHETARRLEDVVKATDDFGLMVDKIGDVVSELGFRMRDVTHRRDEFREIQAFLRWLRDGGFVFLGYRSYTFQALDPGGEDAVTVDPGSGLGILQDEEEVELRASRLHQRDDGRHARESDIGPRPDHQQDQRGIDRPPACAHGLHRRQEAAPGRHGGR